MFTLFYTAENQMKTNTAAKLRCFKPMNFPKFTFTFTILKWT